MPDLLQILSTTQLSAQPYALVVDDHPLVAEGAAHVLMTSAGEILEVFGDCSPFLAIRKGKADFNAFALIKPPFRAELRAFAHRVGRTRQSAVCNPIKLPIEGTARHFRMAVHYCGDLDTHDSSLLLVCFESADAWPGTADGSDTSPGTNERILELEHEIVLNRENLQTVIEELETSNEELQATNEELLASNEELQSTNEELQSANEELQATNEELTTSKEELQSMNEELQTINAELQSKVDDLTWARNDMTNLLNSTEIATVFLDSEMRLRRFTTHATHLFKFIPGDVGRPLSDIVTDLDYPGLQDDASAVLTTLIYCEKQVSTGDGRWFRVRIMPYRTQDNVIDGVVLTFIDITAIKQLEAKLRKRENRRDH